LRQLVSTPLWLEWLHSTPGEFARALASVEPQT